MREEFLHFVWAKQLFNSSELTTISGERVSVKAPGFLNTLSGPDFHESKVRIGQTLWAGSVEIHVKSSDWFRHKHEHDKAYGNVILHVVYEHDVLNDGFYDIPVVELKGRISRSVISKYEQLRAGENRIPCENLLHRVNPEIMQRCVEERAVERLGRKAGEIGEVYTKAKGDLDETFYRTLGKNFGFKWNGPAFEELTTRTPFKIVHKQGGDPVKLEALLLGQAGFLNGRFNDEYALKLVEEYRHLKKKYALAEMSIAAWKTGGLRPPNFPALRVAQFAALLSKHPRAVDRVLTENRDQLMSMFDVRASAFWDCRYTLEKKTSREKPKQLSKGAVENILMNTAAPFLYFFGKHRSMPEYIEKAVVLLENLPPEKNSVINQWKLLNLTVKNALHSQGALTLKHRYCDNLKCLECEIGQNVLQ